MDIKEALAQLDPRDDAQWTSDGLPLVEVMRGLTGDAELTRKQITEADPQFSREAAAEAAKKLDDQADADADAEAEAEAGGAGADPSPEDHQAPEADTQTTPDPAPTSTVTDEVESPVDMDDKFQLDAQINALALERDELTKKIDALQRRRDALQTAEYGDQGPRTKTEERMAYIRSQQKLRAARYADQQTVLKHLSPQQIDPRAPIDRVGARKPQRIPVNPQAAS